MLVFKLFISKNQAFLCTCVTLMSHCVPVVLNEAAQAGPSCPGSEVLLVPIAVTAWLSWPLLFPCAPGHGFLSWEQRTIAVTQTVTSELQLVRLIKDVHL